MKDRAEYIDSIYKKRDIKVKQIKARRKRTAIIVPVFFACVAVCSFVFKPMEKSFVSMNQEVCFDSDNYSEENGIAENRTDDKSNIISGSNDTESYSAAAVPSSAIDSQRKYQDCYYEIPQSFINLVGQNAYDEWSELNAVTEGFMPMLQLIIAFDIQREDFDKANTECGEIYNADVIYTYDNFTINQYYLR